MLVVPSRVSGSFSGKQCDERLGGTLKLAPLAGGKAYKATPTKQYLGTSYELFLKFPKSNAVLFLIRVPLLRGCNNIKLIQL